ncbi:TIM-barrel domain-containing protein [Fulvivirga sediminis]|uniref:DUF5110 domain-containing protein n=1 Tax=Fulvivirga sediminis TaxID=2803949 RepID=A0A937K1R1_9BACT|nr:TIM-barrel domain-containing protein [Fulvivirga sediminis]MBL3658854.1 DUF5110 domain-containing protein [Fulvivirga sediminis]
MKRSNIFLAVILIYVATACGHKEMDNSVLINQKEGLVAEDIAVFYPDQFDSVQTLPSMAVIKDLNFTNALPGDWAVKPEFSTTDTSSIVRIPFPKGTDLYGNGEVTGPLRRNGTEIKLWNTDNFGYGKFDGKQLYQAHPWVLGVRPDGSSFGIIADNTYRQTFELKNPITITSQGPGFRVIVIEKDNPEDVLKALADLTGKMKLPPLWALGYQQSRYSYYPDSQVREIAQSFREKQIPCDVIWMDINYMDGFRIFTFDENGFPDPKKLNDDLHSMNIKAVYMIDPGVKRDSSYTVYQQGSAGNHWVQNAEGDEFNGEVWPGQCAFPDFTRPETREWWAGLYQDFMKLGIDGIWNDMNEPAVFDGPEGSMPFDNIHRGGGDLPAGEHIRYHNVYGLLMVKASREGIMKANPDLRPFILSRANYLGGQRYAATWSGDNVSSEAHMKMSIPMTITLGLSGQPFNGPDIGGFTGDANEELLAQWMSLAPYYPFCRNHSAIDVVRQEPWSFGKKTEDVSRTAVNRRYRMMPYLYTLFHEASISGLPVMRPAFFADVKDQKLRKEEEAFLLGDKLLVIPSWAKNPALPKGDWKSIPFEHEDDGYQATVKLKDASIVPMSKLIQSTEEYSTDSLTLYVNINEDGKAEGELYNDAGQGYDYQSGGYEWLQFKVSNKNGSSYSLEVNKKDGSWDKHHTYRLAIVNEGGVSYSDWKTEDLIFSVNN